MKAKIHPEYVDTKVTCLGCGTTFESKSTMPEITVDICSQCHPFYTGKQKLVDTAGRVDRFKAAREKAEAQKEALVKKGQKALSKAEAAAMLQADAEINEDNTVEIAKTDSKTQAKQKDQDTADK